jgi:hypothetical protein
MYIRVTPWTQIRQDIALGLVDTSAEFPLVLSNIQYWTSIRTHLSMLPSMTALTQSSAHGPVTNATPWANLLSGLSPDLNLTVASQSFGNDQAASALQTGPSSALPSVAVDSSAPQSDSATSSMVEPLHHMLGPAAPAVATKGTESHTPNILHTSAIVQAFIQKGTTSELLLLQSVIAQELKSHGVLSCDQELCHHLAPDTHREGRLPSSSKSSATSAQQEPKPHSQKQVFRRKKTRLTDVLHHSSSTPIR